jgi:hypothetical protein
MPETSDFSRRNVAVNSLIATSPTTVAGGSWGRGFPSVEFALSPLFKQENDDRVDQSPRRCASRHDAVSPRSFGHEFRHEQGLSCLTIHELLYGIG